MDVAAISMRMVKPRAVVRLFQRRSYRNASMREKLRMRGDAIEQDFWRTVELRRVMRVAARQFGEYFDKMMFEILSGRQQ